LKFQKLPTLVITLVSVFAALDIVLSAIPLPIPYGPNAGVLMKPSEGILLGPWGGMLAALIGGLVSSVIWPSTAVLGLATWIPGVLGALLAALIIRGRWTWAISAMAAAILAFILHPYGLSVFIYADWDKVIGLLLIFPASRLAKHRINTNMTVKSLMPIIGLVAFTATEMDGATGNLIFLVMAGPVFGLTREMLPPLFIPYTFLDCGVRIFTAIVCALVLTPILVAARKINLLQWPLT
jgi:hypothetical protein